MGLKEAVMLVKKRRVGNKLLDRLSMASDVSLQEDYKYID